MTNEPVTEKPKRGRRPKPEAEKSTELFYMDMWEDEYELFAETARPKSMASFLREAVHELINSRVQKVEPPRPVTRGLGTPFTMLLSEQEKISFENVAGTRFELPLSGLIRAAGMRKVMQGRKG